MDDEQERKGRSREVVLGQEMAAALEAERRRLARGEGMPSSMPDEAYDRWAGELGLYDPRPVPLDEALAAYVGRFAAADRGAREEMRRATSLDQAYTLLAFARRSAVFAMRASEPSGVVAGLTACAAIELERVDRRDVLLAVAILFQAVKRCGADAARLLGDAAAIGDDALQAITDGFLSRPEADRRLRDAWGLVEVEAPGGAGLLQWGFERWAPTVDLAAAAITVAGVISADEYQADDPLLASEMPPVWLRDAGDAALGTIIESADGTATIHGRLRPSADADHASQQLTVFLLEVRDDDAQRLAAMARRGSALAALLGVAVGRLFALVVARSWVEGVPSHETTDRLARLAAPLAEALRPWSTSAGGEGEADPR
jgi:hypothetical protein